MVESKKTPKYGPGELPVEYTSMRWDEMTIGEEFGPIEYTVKESSHKRHSECQQNYHPWYVEKSPWSGPLYFPFETWCMARVLSRWKYGRLNAGIYAGADWQFFKPAKLGQKLIGRCKIADKYKKRGKEYVVIECITEDEDGDVILKCREEMVLLADAPPDLKIR